MNPIIINGDKNMNSCEVVDGKQRLMAILSWVDGKIDAHCPCGEIIDYNSLSKIEIRGTHTSLTLRWNFVNLNKKEVMEYYIKLNSGGTIHTKEELNKVKLLLKELEN